MSNGESAGSGIPILGPILDALGGLLGNQTAVQDLAQSVGQVEKAAWANTINVAAWSFGLFGGILNTLGDLLKSLGKLFESLFGEVIWGFIKRLFEAIKNWILNLRNWIKLHVAALQKIQRALDQARAKQMRFMIDVLQRIRRILVPFRLLHLGFARKLDAYLVGLESDIGAKWAKLIAHQNQVLGVLNAIIDPRQLLRPGHTLGSLGTMVAAVHGAIGAADLRTLFCMAPTTAATPLTEPWVTMQAGVVSDIKQRGGDYGEAFGVRDDTLRNFAIDLGTTPLT